VNAVAGPATFTVALTGGIATGKSATTQRFAQLGAPVFDADVIAHDVVAVGQPALEEIRAVFGNDMLTHSGELDRARLRERVFADVAARRRLEAIVHPRVHATLLQQVHDCTSAYCILAIPLLVECRADYAWVERVLTTDAPREVQVQRLTHRSGIDAALAQRMLDAQATRAQRVALAHDIIDNTGPIAALDAIVPRLHRRYLALGEGRKART
jgi:dephospho-CoA kinase